MQELSEVLLCASGPSCQVRAQPTDDLAEHLKRAVRFLKSGPVARHLSRFGNRRKTLKLLNW